LLAKTSFGFEDILADELEKLGATNLLKVTRAVTFDADLELMYKVNLWSRVSLRILKPLKSFPAGSEQQLYDEVKKIDWSEFLSVEETLAVDGVVSNSALNHSLYVALKTKDAIVDQFREKTGRRPSVDTAHPKIRINVHISKDVANISLDSSGESLHKRGYRNQTGEAPINETLAAGMVLLSGWDKKSPLIELNPFGQLPILEDGDVVVRNSQTILVYVARKWGGEAWLPTDAISLARVAQWLMVAENEIARGPGDARLHDKFGYKLDVAQARDNAKRILSIFEAHLAQNEWLALGRPTIADIACMPYIALGHEGGVPLDPYPAVAAWVSRVKKLPGFIGMPAI